MNDVDIDLNAALAEHDMDDIDLVIGQRRIPLTHWLAATWPQIGYPVSRRAANDHLDWLRDTPERSLPLPTPKPRDTP